MSLVNDMLRDLEKRKASESADSTNSVVSRESMIEPRKAGIKKKDAALFSLAALVVVLIVYILAFDGSQDVLTAEPEIATIEHSKEKAVETALHQVKPVIEAQVSTEDKGNVEEPVESMMSSQETIERAPKELKKEAATASVIAKEKTLAAAKPAKQIHKQEKSIQSSSLKEASSKSQAIRETKKTTEPEVTRPEKSLSKADKVTPPKSDERELNRQERRNDQAKEQSSPLNVVLSPSALDLKTASEAISLFEVGKPQDAYTLMENFIAENTVVEKTIGIFANRLLQEQRFDDLSRLLEERGNPLSLSLRQVKARWMLIQGEQNAAIDLLEQAKPDIEVMPEYYALLASLYQRTGQAGKAFEQYSQLIQSNDIVADWWAGLGVASDQLKQTRQATFAYQQAMSLPGLNRALEQYIAQRLQALSTLK